MNQDTIQGQLVYDGRCDICGWWVRYWGRLTGPRVEYVKLQNLPCPYRGFDTESLKKHIVWFGDDGSMATGAGAAFQVLAQAGRGSLLAFLYRRLPGFALLAELVYRLAARHRGLLAFFSHALYGKGERMPYRVETLSWLLLRLIGLVYVGAFLSFAFQADGLIGSNGIQPVSAWYAFLQQRFGSEGWLLAPGLFWFVNSDFALQAVCWCGVAAGLLIVLNRWTLLALAAAFCAYLSLVQGGQVFMSYQWDYLLLECGFLAFLLQFAPAASRSWVVLGFRWLLFRLSFLSGWVKLNSGDAAWQNWSALEFHFETQPLPSLLAWYAHHLPDMLLMAGAALTLYIEFFLCFLFFAPRRIRAWAVVPFVALQLLIIATGNYGFFNLLCLILCLAVLDDQYLIWLGKRLRTQAPVLLRPLRAWAAILVLTGWAGISGANTLMALHMPLADILAETALSARRFGLSSNYGPFAVMTRERVELVYQGSLDGENWRNYVFRYKPMDIGAPPVWIIPHQPRLDWQLWFAALGPPERSAWLRGFHIALFENEASVIGLLRENPFADEAPRYLRVLKYRYRFAHPQERQATGNWWTLEPLGLFLPAFETHL